MILVRYIRRGKNKAVFGAIVSRCVDGQIKFGYSMVHPSDYASFGKSFKLNGLSRGEQRSKAVSLALGREITENDAALPVEVIRLLPDFIERSKRYFRKEK